MAVSALELISEAIDALTHADAARLQRLAQEAHEAEMPHPAPELRLVAERRRTLERLLALTRRNLQLLGWPGRQASGYGEARR